MKGALARRRTSSELRNAYDEATTELLRHGTLIMATHNAGSGRLCP